MIRPQDILHFTFGQQEWDLIDYHAHHARVGGMSSVRNDREDRMTMLNHDQLVGQMCEAAVYKMRDRNLHWYNERRKYFNAFPHASDNGVDIVMNGYDMDVKGSLMRSSWRSVLEYNLPVQPKEMYQGRIYILGLTSEQMIQNRSVMLVGWAFAEDFPQHPGGGVFTRARTIQASNLRPLYQSL